MAKTPEQSTFTGAKERIEDLKQRSSTKSRSSVAGSPTHRWERSRRRQRSGWMSPLEIDEKADPLGADASGCGRRASLEGFPFNLLVTLSAVA